MYKPFVIMFAIITFLFFLITSIASVAFEDKQSDKDIDLIYELKSILDDYVLNYCSTFDSFTINRLYSQKKILNNEKNNNRINKKFFVYIKKKPLNPNLIKLLKKETNVKISNFSSSEVNLDYLSNTKKDFLKTLLPLISYENKKISIERSKLKSIKDFLVNFNTLPNPEIRFLEKTAIKYKLRTKNKYKLEVVNELLDLVDIIPNSIVLAQAANESGWGSSRFAREYNALFGEYTYDFTNGVVPLLRKEGDKHLVKAFDSIDNSVQSYFNNLNSHYAYKEFREVRKIMRKNNNFTNIELLVNELDTYAADKNYIDTILSIIKINKLDQFDNYGYMDIKS